MKKNNLELIAFILVVIAGLNSGLSVLFSISIVSSILSFIPYLYKIFYILVGLSAAYLIYLRMK